MIAAILGSVLCSAAMAHAQAPAPIPQPQPTVDLPIIPYPTPNPTQPPPAGLPNPVQIIQNWINARIWFPAETFIQAITEATEAIFTAQLEAIKEPMKSVLGFILFGGVAIFGNAALPDQVARLGEYMVAAAVPLWALSLAIMGLSVLTRNAANMGYATNDLAMEGVRWGLICLASGSGLVIVNLVHSGSAPAGFAVRRCAAPRARARHPHRLHHHADSHGDVCRALRHVASHRRPCAARHRHGGHPFCTHRLS
jgi:hypothetical protein